MATKHNESGQCTSNELVKIIEQIAPNVIFEEVPPSKFDAVYTGFLKDSLEIRTIKAYLNRQPIAHVPVDADLDEITDSFSKSDYQVILNLFARHCPEYRSLYHQRQLLADENGFAFLNSEEWTRLSKRMDVLEKEIIKGIGSSELSKRNTNWLNVLDRRNNEMIKNSYQYCEKNTFDKGLFLVGVEHKRQLIDKIADFEKNSAFKIDWNFNYLNN